MDSLTQAVLGASVATAAAPKGYRKRAMLTGALLGTLPDLDVFIQYHSDIDNFTRHRGASHSLLVLPFVAALLLPLLRPLYTAMSNKRLYLMALLALITHPLLDSLTAYGTQLFYPLPVTPTFIASIFIVDPLYTGWLLIGVLAYLIRSKLQWLNTMGLIISSLYLVVGIGIQQIALTQLTNTYPDTKRDDWFIGVAGGSPMCWHGVNVREGEYIETLFNIRSPNIMAEQKYHILPSTAQANTADWQRLKWFNPDTVVRLKPLTNGETHHISSDLRMGEFGTYIFQFVIKPEKGSEQRAKNLKPWQPFAQNEIAKQYQQLNAELSFGQRKLKQLGRCLGGGI